MKKHFFCFSLSLAKYLCKQGFRITGTKDNRYYLTEHFIFLFDDTPELRSAVKRRVR